MNTIRNFFAYSLVFCTFLFLTSCVNYNKIQFQSESLFGYKKLQKKLPELKFYVHKQDSSIVSLKLVTVDSNLLSGIIDTADNQDLKGFLDTNGIQKEFRNQVHLYISDSTSTISKLDIGERAEINVHEIGTVEIAARNGREQFLKCMRWFFYFVVGILSLVVIIMFIGFMTVASDIGFVTALKTYHSASDAFFRGLDFIF